MTLPPLPETPCFRVQLDYLQGDGSEAGSRFFLSYGGGPPTPAQCIELATSVAASWATNLAPIVYSDIALVGVDAIDIASYTGASGNWAGNNPGTAAGSPIQAQVATNVEFGIARRYRGGKPRMFIPPPGTDAVATPATWTPGFVGQVNGAMAAFFAGIATPTGLGAVEHVNVSFYQSFQNLPNSSGRIHAYPKYRAVALVDNVESYIAKSVMGAQRRRRTATTY